MQEGAYASHSEISAALEAFKSGDQRTAVNRLETVIETCERDGSKQGDLAEGLLAVARLYDLMEQPLDAEKAFERALTIKQQYLQPDNAELQNIMREVATFHHINQHLERAEELYRILLKVKEGTGESGLDLAGTLSSLAELYADQGGYNDAIQVLARALAIEKEILGQEHSSVGQTCSDMADCYAAMGRYQEAETYELSAFQIFRKVLGPQHAKTSSSMKRTFNLQEKLRRQDAMTKVDVTWAG